MQAAQHDSDLHARNILSDAGDAPARAANDNVPLGYNCHLHLAYECPPGAPLKHSRSPAFTLLTVGGDLTYDKADQPTYVSGAANGSYKYDGNFKRVKSVVNGKTIYNVYNAAGTLTFVDKVTDRDRYEYVPGGLARIENSHTLTYLHKDHLGSASAGTSDNGFVSWRQNFTPFGRSLTSPLVNNNRDDFTGHIKDSATGLTYMQARYYSN